MGGAERPFHHGSSRRTVSNMTVKQGAILCDSNGCWNALEMLSPAERFAAPADDTIRHRAKREGWTIDHQDRDICSRHLHARGEAR
jgi:hypothetical protein